MSKPKFHFSILSFVLKSSPIANPQNVDTFNNELRILIYESHPLARKESLDLSQLGGEDWVKIKAEVHPIYQVIEAFCKKAGFERSGKIVQEVSSLELMFHFVGLKKGIGFVPSFFDTSSFPNVIKRSSRASS